MAHWILPGTADTQCGFKFFTGPLARSAVRSLRTAGFAFDLELLAACLRLGASVTEVPVYWRDIAGSTFSARHHSATVFRELAAIWLRSRVLRGWPAAPLAARGSGASVALAARPHWYPEWLAAAGVDT
jgi:hypothetical protein